MIGEQIEAALALLDRRADGGESGVAGSDAEVALAALDRRVERLRRAVHLTPSATQLAVASGQAWPPTQPIPDGAARREREATRAERGNVHALPNITAAANFGFDVAGSCTFDLAAVFSAKPSRGIRRPITFTILDPAADEDDGAARLTPPLTS